MKKIEAIIRLAKFDAVRDALAGIGVRFFTLQEVKGFGLQGGEKLRYRGSTYDADFIPRLQLDILVDESKVAAIVACIQKAAYTGQVGDGKISVLPVDSVLRIRTGEADQEAL